jgi:hypothetical protein
MAEQTDATAVAAAQIAALALLGDSEDEQLARLAVATDMVTSKHKKPVDSAAKMVHWIGRDIGAGTDPANTSASAITAMIDLALRGSDDRPTQFARIMAVLTGWAAMQSDELGVIHSAIRGLRGRVIKMPGGQSRETHKAAQDILQSASGDTEDEVEVILRMATALSYFLVQSSNPVKFTQAVVEMLPEIGATWAEHVKGMAS